MSNLNKYFKNSGQNDHQDSRNKENNLSFRNIAANTQYQNQSRTKNLKVDKSFRSIFDQSSSFYNNDDSLQDELNYVGSCINHSNKLAEYTQSASRQQYCKLCAAKLASLGYKMDRSQNFVSRDVSPTMSQAKKSIPSINIKQDQVSESKIKPNTSFSSYNNAPVKFSSFISQKKQLQTLETKYEETNTIIEDYIEIYSEKMDMLQQMINDIRIKDTQYINKIKAQNLSIYENAKNKEILDNEKGNFDLFGKSLLRDCPQENIKFKLPTEEKIQRLTKLMDLIQEITKQKQSTFNNSNMALIKSKTSSESNNTKDFLLKNSSSNSNLSNKSNFKKGKKEKQEKFGSQFNPGKCIQEEEQIQSSRFSSNSAIVRKTSNQSGNQIRTQSTELIRRNTLKSLEDSHSCADTPESIKSKISGNSFVLPKNAAVTMFEKIFVCESVDIKPEELHETSNLNEQNNIPNCRNSKLMVAKESQSYGGFEESSKSSYANRSGNYSISVISKSRKSFNRYQTYDNQE